MGATTAEPAAKTTQNKVFVRPWREVTLIALILMELSWVTLWYQFFMRSNQEVPYHQAVIVLSVMTIFVYLLNRLVVFLDIKLIYHRLILLLALGLNLFIGLKLLLYTREEISLSELLNRPMRTFQDMADVVPAEFVVMLFILLVCWRGIAYSDYQIGSVNALSGFRLGIIMFFVYGLTLTFVKESPDLALYQFLFFSLLSLTTARISVISQLRGGQSIQFNRQWMLGTMMVIVCMIAMSALVVYFTRERLFSLLSLFFSWLIYLVVLLFSPFIFLVLQFFVWIFDAIRIGEAFQFIVQTLRSLQMMIDSLINIIDEWANQFNFDRVTAFFEYLRKLRPLYLWGLLLFLVAAILLGLRRYIIKNERADEEQIQTEQIDEDLIQLLRSSLRRGLDKLADNLDEILRLRRARQYLTAARIRRIYAMLLSLSARLDNPRPASRTPLEFLPQMETLFPALSGELSTITDAYLLVRYGEVPESVDELDRVETAWKRISSAGKERLKSKRRTRSI